MPGETILPSTGTVYLIWGRYNMKKLCAFLTCVTVLALCLPGYADSASAAFRRGVKAEGQNKYDDAFEGY